MPPFRRRWRCLLVIWVLIASGGFLQQFLTLATWCNAFVTSFDCHQPFRQPARRPSITCHQIARDTLSPGQLLSDDEVRHIHAAVRSKCLDAIAVGNLPPGRELELISALGSWHSAVEFDSHQAEGTAGFAAGR